jgi:ABC-type uncharacterized transport system auxiliary subunit
MKPRKPAVLAAAAMTLLTLTGACANKPFLIVHYQLPAPADTPMNKRVSLMIRDIRENKAFLSESARKSLPEFNDTYSLVVVKADGSGNLLGIYEVEALIAETFERRLNSLGLQVGPSADQSEYELEIKLSKFNLDLTGRNWVVTMNYQANLSKNSRVLAVESVDGSAQRLKMMGAGDAEKLLGELLTDMVNRLDLERLFQQAQR